MGKLKDYNGRFCEYDFENALIGMLEQAGWQYLAGSQLPRSSEREVIYTDDLEQFLRKTYPAFSVQDIERLRDQVLYADAGGDFATLHRVYGWLVDGFSFQPEQGLAQQVTLVDFARPAQNIFRVVNQLTITYTDHGKEWERRPDILLYVNGIPVCIFELKNPANDAVGIVDAWEQIVTRYWRDIPQLLHYTPLACITDGVKSRLGTVRTPYEHFYAWRQVNDGDKVSTGGFDELAAMVQGVFAPDRFLEIFRDYIYFADSSFDDEEREIVCRYPQFFAVRRLKASIVTAVRAQSGKGGTYFGATGCGKTYAMAFLARQLAMRCTDVPVMGSPTVLLIVDRDELQEQGAKLFTRSKEFLGLGEVRIVLTRRELREELQARESGGFYITTIQKFCDRQEDKLGLLSERANIICFSDEAHRTQLARAKAIRFSQDADANMKAMLSKPYAKVLREALPHATFVGFTGTPIAETYQTFGEEIARYTMDQAVADGITVPIKYHPRIARVLLDEQKVKEIEAYYRRCGEEGASAEDVQASKKAMSSMEIILGEPSRLERLAIDIHDHYLAACAADPQRVQKALITCASRPIAYALLEKFQALYPEWFTLRRVPEDYTASEEELRTLVEMPTIAMVSSVGSNDKKAMYDYLGGTKNDQRSQRLEAAFKQEHSNFRIAIVVDMWITGFDVPALTYLYNDKPLEKHLLIQTISRVNRKYPGKSYGMIIDYIGIRDAMRQALKVYGGTGSVAPSPDDVAQAEQIFRELLAILQRLLTDFDLSVFLQPDADPALRYQCLSRAAEYVFTETRRLSLEREDGKGTTRVSFKTYFLAMVKRLRAAYDVCQPSGGLGEQEMALAQCFFAVAGFVRKLSGKSELDTESMNRHVEHMVAEALKYSKVENILAPGEKEDIFGPEFTEAVADIKMPATRLEALVKMLRRQTKEYQRTNQVAARKYQEMLEETIQRYHERRKKLSEEEAGAAQEQAAADIIAEATAQAKDIMRDMQADRNSFRKLGLTFEEKAFYDILIKMRDTYNFVYGEDKKQNGVTINERCQALARKIKEIVDMKSSFADWLNNQNVRDQLKFDIKICLVKNGYPPQYSPEVFRQVMDQVENFKENHG